MMLRSTLAIFALSLGLSFRASAAVPSPVNPTPAGLNCQYTPRPLNVDVAQPLLAWTLSSTGPGEAQTAYQILVASTADGLAADAGDLWDSGKVDSDRTFQVPYSGKPLVSGERCFWKVRVWDTAGRPSPYSDTGVWETGPLNPDDWHGKWITAPGVPSSDGTVLGYHAAVSNAADVTKWVQVDLGQPRTIDVVKLHSLDHEVAGFGFPVRFKITASDDPAFTTADTIADESQKDYPNPGAVAVTFRSQGIRRRYVRVTATRLFRRTEGDKTCCFALAEMQVFSGGKNVALHAPVTALDSTEGYGWSKDQLTDGLGLAPDAGTAPAPGPGTTLPIFRTSFAITKPVARAVLDICGLGQYELHFNGKKVGDSVLDPGWTDYRKTCLYQAYDLTDRLRSGTNVIGVMLGNGMYNVVPASGRYTKFTGTMGPPKLIAQLRLTYQDGTSETFGTDAGWKVAGGPITFTSIFGGEDYDARLEKPGWDQSAQTDASWFPAVETTGPGGALAGISRSAPPITVAAILKPEKITQPKPDVWVYDLGQNCAQMPLITVTGRAGQSVRLTPAEVLRPDGTVSQEPSGGPSWYTYTLKGTGTETWSPRFTYYGSRYLQVTGAVPAGSPDPSGLPQIQDLHGQFITSSSPVAGEFSCSNEMFNRTANLIRWAMRSNLMSVMTDCPHRERLGWLEETHLVGPSLMYNFDIHQLFTKVAADTADAQTASGLVPDIAPEYTVFNGGFRDSPEWGSAAVLIPWQVYQWYGDTDILARRYPTMKRYVDYLGTLAKDDILSHGLGDWYDIGPNPPGYAQLTSTSLTATAFYYRDITILQQAASLLGKTDDAKHFGDLATRVRESFNRALYHPDRHSYDRDSQTANAIPLVFGLAPEADRAAIVDNIVSDIRKRHNGLTAGDIGYRYLLRALADGGRSDVIFDMNSRSDKPGYGMMLAKGATSLTEAWDARISSSQDHFMLGHIMEWFYSDLAGIQPDPAAPGFKKILIKPAPVGDVTWAKANYKSIRGTIECNWAIQGQTFTLDVVIPPNCTATVVLPNQFSKTITEGGQPIADVRGITLTPGGPRPPSMSIGSGRYHFTSQRLNP